MARQFSTDTIGRSFDPSIVQAVWDKGGAIAGYDSGVWRTDACGTVIKRGDHGNTASKHGWEIDHIKPVAKGGGDELGNLQPLHWETNRKKADTYPWRC